jgi:hypothetical protein
MGRNIFLFAPTNVEVAKDHRALMSKNPVHGTGCIQGGQKMTWTLGVIGCGNMSYALLRGICRNAELAPERIFVNDLSKSGLHLFENEFKAVSADKADLDIRCGYGLSGGKPNRSGDVLEDTKEAGRKTNYCSPFAAGIRTGFFGIIVITKCGAGHQAPCPTPPVWRVKEWAPVWRQYATAADLEKVRSCLLPVVGRSPLKKQDMDDQVGGCFRQRTGLCISDD